MEEDKQRMLFLTRLEELFENMLINLLNYFFFFYYYYYYYFKIKKIFLKKLVRKKKVNYT